jgi:hypothetical protein
VSAPLSTNVPARSPAAGAARLALERLRASTSFPRVFTATIATHLLHIAPIVRDEITVWRTHAKRIPDPVLSQTALSALRKQGNIEGAALLAALAPADRRGHVVRALCRLQGAYNFLDALSELECENPLANSDQLHQALLATVTLPSLPATVTDYYAHSPHRYDGGVLLVQRPGRSHQRLLEAIKGATHGVTPRLTLSVLRPRLTRLRSTDSEHPRSAAISE